TLLAILACFQPGLRLGTDFRGGTEIELVFVTPVTAGEVRAAVERSGFEAPDVVDVAGGQGASHYIIRVQEVASLSEAQKELLRERLGMPPEGGPVEERCPAGARATEVKFSPGGDKVSARYETAPDLAAIAGQVQGIDGVELRGGGQNVVLVHERDHKV